MKTLNALIAFALLTSCSGFSTGLSHAIKFEHEVEAATEAAQAAYNQAQVVQPVAQGPATSKP